ncbi:DUF2953 domain-containing protein [Paraliobacillus sediminis]|uniref:DUF2953 domain-containing protein n=1 Tax=Paraliobacillus sediminis TaxID=1885916 RepID=UPI000E3B761F|nr:DUF2953 domain-containing protein [Paraliobacillus sediminis]
MIAIIIIILVISLILIIVMSLFINVKLNMTCSQETIAGTIIIHIAGIKIYDRDIEIALKEVLEDVNIDLSESIRSFVNQSQEKIAPRIKFYQKKQRFQKVIRKRLKKVTIHTFNWETTIGTAEATSTGILSGLCWTVKECIGGLLTQFVLMKNSPEFKVTPLFQQRLVESDCTCIFSMRLGQAIYTMMQIGKWNRKVTSQQD